MSFQKAEKFFNDGVENIWNNDLKNALNNFNKVIKLNPIFGNAYSYRGFCKHLLNDTKGAFDDINKSQEINMNNSFILKFKHNSINFYFVAFFLI